jgi:hypothetical protein
MVRRERLFHRRLRIEPTSLLRVTDPIYGQSLVGTSTLTGGTYQGNGTWTNTYFTK